VVEYAQPVLEEILANIAAARSGFPNGGLEIGGILFGTGDKHLARILATRPIICEHAYGPQFLLSEKDHDLLHARLVDARHDPELEGLIPLGWYVVRARGEVSLRESDRQLHSRHFPKGWPIALVFQSEEGAPVRMGIFSSSKEGVLPIEPTHYVEELSTASSEPVEEEPSAGFPEGTEALEASAAQAPEPSFLSDPSLGGRRRNPNLRLIGIAAVVIAVLAVARMFKDPLMAAARNHWRTVADYWAAPPDGGTLYSLQLVGSGDKLTIRWDPDATVLTMASTARLIVRDGTQTTEHTLAEADLLSGVFVHERQSDDVSVTMETSTGTGSLLVETARYLGRPPVGRPDAAPEEGGATEIGRLQTAVSAEESRREELMLELRTLETLATTRSAAVQQTPSPVRQSPPALAEKAPVPRSPATVLLEQRPPAAPSRSPTSAAPPPANPGATAGMLIWTGLLADGRALEIEGSRASAGSLSGSLPGGPVRVTVYPAELGASGLTLLSSESRHAGETVVEEPGPQNSWNRTTYRYDPAAAASLEVVEAPSARRGWTGISMRARGRTLSVIVIRWQRAR